MPLRRLPGACAAVMLFAMPASAQPTRVATIAVRGGDYAFYGVPDSLPAGTHRWGFRNEGKSRHEFIIARLRPGADVRAVVDTLHKGGLRAFYSADAPAVAIGALFAVPGHAAAGELVTRDARGDVLIVFCQLRDSADKPKHDDLGMFRIVRIH